MEVNRVLVYGSGALQFSKARNDLKAKLEQLLELLNAEGVLITEIRAESPQEPGVMH